MTTVPSNIDRVWMTSSYTADGKDCVEITMDIVDGTQDVRDSKNRRGPTLTFTIGQLSAFIDQVKRGGMG